MNALYLRRGAERRLRAGHLWVYSNEVDTGRSSLSEFSSGDLVLVFSATGDTLGSAYMEPHSLICARVYAPGRQCLPDEAFYSERLSAALALRDRVFPQPYYRLIYGDSDGLPGVVADRFGDYIVVQFNNTGVEQHAQAFLQALYSLLRPAGVLVRNDSRQRQEQGIERAAEVVFGEVPVRVLLEENGVRFYAPVHDGQKTGWFYDHRMSRGRLRHWVTGRSVLDVYSYIGGWGVQAAAFGAQRVCCVDSSAAALSGVQENAQLNEVQDKVNTLRGAAVDVMRDLAEQGEQFDQVILDPPAFIRRRRELKKGTAAYRRINELGLRLLRPGGVLVSASCSMHLSRADLVTAVQSAATRAGCTLSIVEQGGQGPDHPVHPAIPETEYLKTLIALKR